MKTKKTLRIGSSDFKGIVKDNHYFVDKTMLIYEFFNNESDVMLMPRPKRFGKTLNLSMIEYFFDIRKQDSKELFSDLEISNKTEFCEKHQNKYPVINITLKNVKENTWDLCLDKFKSIISKLYKQHRYLLNSDVLVEEEKQLFESIMLETSNDIKYKESLA